MKENAQQRPPDLRPTLQDLRFEYHFDITLLAYLAEVNEIVVYRVLLGQAVTHWQAEAILSALSLMHATETNQHPYTLGTVKVVLLPDEHHRA